VGGEVTPDRFVVAKIEGTVVDRVLGDKQIEYVNGHTSSPVDQERRDRLCLDDEEVLALASLGKRLERMHGCPQDIEFAIDRDLPRGQQIILLQCRPENDLGGECTSHRSDEKCDIKTWRLSSAMRAECERLFGDGRGPVQGRAPDQKDSTNRRSGSASRSAQRCRQLILLEGSIMDVDLEELAAWCAS